MKRLRPLPFQRKFFNSHFSGYGNTKLFIIIFYYKITIGQHEHQDQDQFLLEQLE
jgi:hypothetical protein